jgi:hypothetical protein
MTWNSTLGLISTIALFLPIILILTLKLGAYRSFPALLFYYALVFVYNLMTEGYIRADENVIHYWGLGNNLLDTPLMLWFLTYFSTSIPFTKRMKLGIALFVVFEIIVVAVNGMTLDTVTIIMAPGLAFVIGFCLYFFVRQSRITIVHRKAAGKALITASLVFAYGCYSIIYLLYYVLKTKEVENTFLIYFLVTTISSALMCSGILIERKRIQKLNELKIARKELTAIYNEPATKSTTSLKAAILDFDRDQWN